MLTAGHCVGNAGQPRKLLVIGGRTQLGGGQGTVRHVASIEIEPNDAATTLSYDAAVITLRQPMPYKPLPVAGPKDSALYAAGRTATVLGWAPRRPALRAPG